MSMLLATILLQATAPTAPDLTPMVALYQEACLDSFPSDGQLDALMAKKGATPLSPDEVKVTLRDDPGRGWRLIDGGRRYLVFLELPPFHACSVRGGVGSDAADLAPYRAVLQTFKSKNPGFSPQPPADLDQGAIHIHAESEYRQLPGGTGEQLIVIAQQITDPERRAKGETGTDLRFVHQIKQGN